MAQGPELHRPGRAANVAVEQEQGGAGAMGDGGEPDDEKPAEAVADRDEPRTPDAIIDHARLTAQAKGKAMLPEIITTLDRLIAQRLSSARAGIAAYPDQADWDWDDWGRITYVLESLLRLLEKLGSDDEIKAAITKRLRAGPGRG